MANWSANGSKLMIGAATLHATNVTLIKGARLAENTASANSSTSFIKVVSDHSWNCDVPWDDTNLPDTDFGLIEGARVTLVFYDGDSGKTETLTNTTVERLENVMNNENDIIRTRISGRGGVLTRAVT
jgi:hypothetical protein